jgi:hypothetical protein
VYNDFQKKHNNTPIKEMSRLQNGGRIVCDTVGEFSLRHRSKIVARETDEEQSSVRKGEIKIVSATKRQLYVRRKKKSNL